MLCASTWPPINVYAFRPRSFFGAMGSVTRAGVAAQTHAEAMAGIALAQLVRPGCPDVYGSFHNSMSLRSGALTFGSPEANLVTMALAQLARRLMVPVCSGGGQITAANSADGQAMQNSASAMWATDPVRRQPGLARRRLARRRADHGV